MINTLKSSLGHRVRSLLQRPLVLDEGHVAFGIAKSRLREQARDADRDRKHERERTMRRDLYALMQRHPESRTVVRHLDLVERTLRREGYAAVEALPVRIIEKALAQLEDLVRDWSLVGLAELRSRLAVMLKSRRLEAGHDAAHEAASTSSLELDLATRASTAAADVTEVDHSVFEETERDWAGRVPAELVAAVAARGRG